MIELALYQPLIPPNTGNLIRLMANIGSILHLIGPLGFELDDKKLRRAGLDYHEWATVQQYTSFEHFKKENTSKRIIACETNGQTNYAQFKFTAEDIILLGSETTGVPDNVLDSCDHSVFLPMQTTARSLNLSNAAAIVTFEAWRQLDFT